MTEGMLTLNPCQSVAKGNQILIQGPESVAAAIVKSCEGVAETDGRMTEGSQRQRADHRTVSVYVALMNPILVKKPSRVVLLWRRSFWRLKPPRASLMKFGEKA